MSDRAADSFETLLRQAFAPIEPPAELEERLEERLSSLVEAAADELEKWELEAIGDPKNWPHLPNAAATLALGGAAAVGLVLVRTQRKRHKRRAAAHGVRDLAARTVRDATREARKVFDELAPDR